MKTTTKNIKVKIKTSDGLLLRGKINLNSESEKVDRLSDFFVKGTNPFLTLYGVAAQGGDTVIIVNKKHIVTVTPDGDDTVEDDVVITGELADIFDGESSDIFDPNLASENSKPVEIEMAEGLEAETEHAVAEDEPELMIEESLEEREPVEIEQEIVKNSEPEIEIIETPDEPQLEFEVEDAPAKAAPEFELKEVPKVKPVPVKKPVKPEKKPVKIEDFVVKKKDKPSAPEPELQLDEEEFHISDLDEQEVVKKPAAPPKPKKVIQSTEYKDDDDWDR